MNIGSQSVAEAAQHRLSTSGYLELRNVSCEYDGRQRVLTLQGRVSTYYLKQLAQSVLVTSKPVHRIVNLVEVDSASKGTLERK